MRVLLSQCIVGIKYDVIERFIEEHGYKDQVLAFTQEGEVMDVKI